MHIVLARTLAGFSACEVAADGTPLGPAHPVDDLARYVARNETDATRWVWDDTSRWYPPLLNAGIRISRCVDLRLCHAILRASVLTAGSEFATAASDEWDGGPAEDRVGGALFELEEEVPPDPLTEFARQRAAITATGESGRLGLLLSVESAGALAAAEMRHSGLPWRADRHEALLERELGPRPSDGARPGRMHDLLGDIRHRLGDPDVNPDSPPELLKALRRAGIPAESTRSWELKGIEHPVIAPLLEYKRLARLLTANGWNWLDQNVVDGRFHPDFVPGGVVTGRWASKGGGGALQLPRQVRSAVVADDGWTFVVADAAQLEPRILAAMSADRGMVEAGAGSDLYAGIVASGAVRTRDHAKVAMLGAMYGATTGESGRLLPGLTRTYPKAIALVEDAARAGENGAVVSTLLGRSSPPGPAAGWDETATEAQLARVRERARAWGRFTRNFVVQGTAAEWALCWLAGVRLRLRRLGGTDGPDDRPHLVFFLHDELVVHTPSALAPEVASAFTDAAEEAGRLLFGPLPVTFPLTVAVVDDYGSAK